GAPAATAGSRGTCILPVERTPNRAEIGAERRPRRCSAPSRGPAPSRGSGPSRSGAPPASAPRVRALGGPCPPECALRLALRGEAGFEGVEQAPGDLSQSAGGLRRLDALEGDPEEQEARREGFVVVPAHGEARTARAHGLEDAEPRRDAGGELGRGADELDAHLMSVRRLREGSGDIAHQIFRQRAWAEPRAPPQTPPLDAIDAESPERRAPHVPGHQVPEPLRVDDVERLDAPRARPPPFVQVLELELLVLATRGGQGGEQFPVDRAPARGERQRRRLEG